MTEQEIKKVIKECSDMIHSSFDDMSITVMFDLIKVFDKYELTIRFFWKTIEGELIHFHSSIFNTFDFEYEYFLGDVYNEKSKMWEKLNRLLIEGRLR